MGSRNNSKTHASWQPNRAGAILPQKPTAKLALTCGAMCTVLHTHMRVLTIKVQWDFLPVFLFFPKCPHSPSCYFIFSLFTINFFLTGSFPLFPEFFFFFFKESLGQQENCWAETQKADSAHASLFSVFLPAQLRLETGIQDSQQTCVPGVSKHYDFDTTQERCEWTEYVTSYISCTFGEVTKIRVWGRREKRGPRENSEM